MRDRPVDGEQRDLWPVRRALTVMIGIAVATVVLLALAAYLVLGRPVLSPAKALGTDGLFELVRLVFYVVAGIGGIVALVMTYRRQRYAERAQKHTEHDAAQRRVTDMYAHAIERLGDGNAAVRLGALYLLERLAQEHAGQRQTIVNVICAYLRMPFTPPGEDDERAAHEELQVRLTAQSILGAHLSEPSGYWPGLSLDLSRAVLVDLDLNAARPGYADFTKAEFHGDTWFAAARLDQGARFEGARFHGTAWFEETWFGGPAEFTAARFQGDAWFRAAEFAGGAWFDQDRFDGETRFERAEFGDDAWFTDARFHHDLVAGEAAFRAAAVFRGARFHGAARFSGTRFDTVPRFADATIRDPRGAHAPPAGWEIVTGGTGEGRFEPAAPGPGSGDGPRA